MVKKLYNAILRKMYFLQQKSSKIVRGYYPELAL